MKAFHNDPAIKEKYLSRVHAHKLADEIIKGRYWERGKGCAIGCTIHSSEHKAYERELGIPEWLARLEDTIFEGLPDKKAKEWPEKFLGAITLGQELDKIKAPFLIFVLESTFDKFDHQKFPDVKKAIDTVIDLYKFGETDPEKFREAVVVVAEAVAEGAAVAARATVAAVAEAVAAARAALAAVAAARAALAAVAAARAALAVVVVARAALAVAAVAEAVAAEAETYEKFADKLLELIKEDSTESTGKKNERD